MTQPDTDAQDRTAPARTKAALVDPDSLLVTWTAEHADSGEAAAFEPVPIDEVIPLANVLGVPDALIAVRDTGLSQSLQTDLVSTSKGSMSVLVSIHRLPGGELLVLEENAWQPNRPTPGAPRGRTSRRSR